MPLINLDHAPIDVACKSCGNKITSTVGHVERKHKVICQICGKETHFTLEEADHAAHEADRGR
jgi:transcription elongation factor Elf1